MDTLVQRRPRATTRPSDVSGQTQAFLAITPVQPGQEQELTGFLRALGSGPASPFARLERTHTARLLVVHDFHHDPSWGQQPAEHLDLPLLVFSAAVDGDLDSWLDQACAALALEAPQVWGRCVGGPGDGDPAALKAYLAHNQVHTGVFFAAYGHATVAQVRRSLRQRERLVAFAVRAQALEPAALRDALLQEMGSPA